MGTRLFGAVICLAICTSAWALDLNEQRQFDIPAQKLSTALVEFSRQAKAPVVSSTPDIERFNSPGVAGRMSLKDALKALLQGTGLDIRTTDSGAIAVGSFGTKSGGVAGAAGQTPQMAQPPAPVGSDVLPEPGKSPLTEIIVTAQKKSERLQDVPVPVSVVSASALVANNQLRLQDYYTAIPGLSVPPASTESAQFISIRGITTGGGNPAVGVEVDDVPFGATAGVGGGQVVPDIDPGDLARVEVLRGPQGTLYGASSLGGLLKFVTLDPSTEALSGNVQAGTSSVYNGAELGYNFRGSVNVPLSDTFAIRASGFTRQDPGYIDNPILHTDGVNEARVSGGHLSALWRPSDTFSLKLSALYETTKGDGSNDVDVPTAGYPQTAGLHDLQQNYIRGVGAYERKVQAYSATVTAKLGRVDLTAVSGYNVNSFSDSFDITYLAGGLTNAFFPGVTGTPEVEHNKTGKFTEEVRLSAPIGDRLDWVLGGFYTHESSQWAQDILAEDSTTGAVVGNGIVNTFPSTYQEYAGFADLTVHITDRFDVQLGGRESEIRQSSTQTDTGIYTPIFYLSPSPYILPKVVADNSAFTYLLTPRFKISSDLMVYARVASGYRAGGANVAPGVPREYSPDKTQNYELGVKGEFLDRTLSIDASLYYVDWKDIQVQLQAPQSGEGYTGNGSRAKSQGVEISVESRPLTGLTLNGWVAFSDAELTEPFPPNSANVHGVSGDRLPYSSRFSGNLSAEQDFPLFSNVNGFVGATESYVGEREGVFTASAERQNLPAYSKTDLRTGGKFDSWTLNLYVNNVTDKRGVLNGGLGQVPPFAFIYIQPRTVGLSVGKAF
jgi:iron complex outermembrane receptor protein